MKKLMMILMILAMAITVQADVLRWTASTGEVDGYMVYWGTESGSYPNKENVGNVTEVGTPGLEGALAEHFMLNPGDTYFIVRAYNIAGESADSNIASLAIEGYAPGEDNFPIKIVIPGPATITIEQN